MISRGMPQNKWHTTTATEEEFMHTIQQVPLALIVALTVVHGLGSGARATVVQGDAILGYWQRGEGEAIVEIRRRADHYHGVVVASERRPEIIEPRFSSHCDTTLTATGGAAGSIRLRAIGTSTSR